MLDLVIDQRRRDLGGFEVGRVLPFAKRRMVGPFIFFDHLGPVTLPPGIPRSVDVRPHPHIGLATVTYLFDGEIMHRDSVGSEAPIHPGEVNWMVAGRGVTHSERFEKARAGGDAIHGIQSWVALPAQQEECAPSFAHHGQRCKKTGCGRGCSRESHSAPNRRLRVTRRYSTCTGCWRLVRGRSSPRSIPSGLPTSSQAVSKRRAKCSTPVR